MTKSKFPRMIDQGAKYEKPGRKFGYTNNDFLEAYLGKDYARPANLDVEQNQVFGYLDSFKNKYPIDKYLQTPIFEAKRKQM